MEFGKLRDIGMVDFRMPRQPDASPVLPTGIPRPAPPRCYIGCTGWAMKEWAGTVYPPGARPGDYLAHYGQQFNTIELNATHYRVPSPETIEKWSRDTPADFRFCPKVPQAISHSRDLGTNTAQIEAFAYAMSGLGVRLGPSFLQLPPYFGLERWGILARFLERWPKHIPIAIEFREASWFRGGDLHPDAIQVLEAHQAGAVITDVAGRRDVLHLRVTAPFVLLRFVGNDLHASDYERARAWAAQIQHWFAQGLPALYFFAHEPDNLQAPQLADYAHQLLGGLPGVSCRGPVLAPSAPGRQLGLF